MAANCFGKAEKELLDNINKGSTEYVEHALESKSVGVNFHDQNGMTPLMHASYKGNASIVNILLENGADVNNNEQEHKYTALMFATLSGSQQTVQALLEHGADTNLTNAVNRTASQLGAFVGRHDCVSLINNFLPRADIDYFTNPTGLEKKGKLHKSLAEPLHSFLIITTLNPLKLALFLGDHSALLEHATTVERVIELKCQSLYKEDINEVLALKMHHFRNAFTMASKWFDNQTKSCGMDGFVKHLLQGRTENGFSLLIENLIRESIRTFPYTQSNILQQLVKTLALVEKGCHPTALEAISQAIYGIQSVDNEEKCFTCGDSEARKKCSACKTARYCDGRCQKYDWATHKRQCRDMRSSHGNDRNVSGQALEKDEQTNSEKRE